MGFFDKVARILHENTEDTKNVAADTNTAKKAEPASPPLDSEARTAYEQGFDCYRNREYEEAARLYRTSADLGFFRAQYALALLYMEGYGVEKDLDAAELWAQKAADQGYESAAKLVKELQEKRSATSDALALGMNFYEQENYEQAVRHFRTAANADHPYAQACLAVCYATGEGVEKDLDTAELWAKRALDSGDEKAAALLDAIHEEQRDEAFESGVSCYEQGDYTQAFQYFHTAAQLGLPNAQFSLALCYFEGEGVEQNLDMAILWVERASEQGFEAAAELLELLKTAKAHPFDLGVACYEKGDYTQAVQYFRIAAEQGDVKAQFNLAHCYAQGEGVEKNQSEAVRWYRAAAEQGDQQAAEALARLRKNEGKDAFFLGVACLEKGDYVQAARFFHNAAELGHAKSQYNLALCYEGGNGVEQDQQEAVRWYRAAAEQGLADAQNNLAVFYEQGRGVKQDQHEAVRWYRAAAEQGYASAQYNLALCYEDGNGVEQDHAEAVHWYQKAADQGNAKAQYNLAICYARGEGVEKDLDTAITWAERAHEQGYEAADKLLFNLRLEREAAKPHFLIAAERGDANAQFDLALRYADGDGVEQDQSKAVHWYQKAAEQGHAKAQFNLAVRYENGNGIERDQTKAVRWYLKAAQQGHSGAQFNLALCYRDGDGVQEDQWKASHWFHMAAEQGDAVAQFNLAVRYEEGRGIHQNQSEAIRWYRTAAYHGYANAQNNLAICYRDGDGVAVDLDTAELWAQKAAQQGYESAPKLLEGIRQRKNNR